MKKVFLILALVMCMGTGHSQAMWPFSSIQNLLRLGFSKTEASLEVQDASLAKISGNQVDMQNTMTNMMNVQNEMKLEMTAIAAANIEVKGMIGSVDQSLKQNQQVGSGTLINTTIPPEMINIIFIAMCIVIIVLIITNGFTIKAFIDKNRLVNDVGLEKKKYKQKSYEMQAQYEKIVTALAKDPNIVFDFNGNLHNGKEK